MAVVVQKYGGSSVADVKKLTQVADRVMRTRQQGHDVVVVYTRAPKPAGRGQQERKTPVHVLAEKLKLPVRTPQELVAYSKANAGKTSYAFGNSTGRFA